MFLHHHDLCLHVLVINGGHHGAPRGDSQGGILNSLEFAEAGGTDIGESYLGCVGEDRVYDDLVGGHQSLLLLTPRGASESLEQ